MSNEDTDKSFLAPHGEATDYEFTLEIKGPGEAKIKTCGTVRRLEHEPDQRWQAKTGNHYGLSSHPGTACLMAMMSLFDTTGRSALLRLDPLDAHQPTPENKLKL